MKPYEIGIVVDYSSPAVKFYAARHKTLHTHADISEQDALFWLLSTIVPILREHLAFQVCGVGMGVGIKNESTGETELPDILENYINGVPDAIMEILRARKAVGITLFPFSFLTNTSTPDVLLAITGVLDADSSSFM